MALTRPTTTRLDDTNEIVATGFVDDVKYPEPTPPPPPPPSGGNSLDLSGYNNEYLHRVSDVILTGQFSMQVTCQDLSQNGTGIPLFCGTTTANRVLIDSGLGKVNFNIGGAALVSKVIPNLDVVAKNTYKVFRDSNNDIYFQVDSETPILLVNSTNNFTLRYIGKGSSSFKITGRVHDFKINNIVYDLSEGIGDLLGADWIIKSDLGLTHINENVWSVAPPGSSAIRVINAGISGENSLDMAARFDNDVLVHNPDMVFILPGTNDILNSAVSAHQTPAQYKANLMEMVGKVVTAGATPVIWNLLPCIDSICKMNHDYTSFYGDESTYNMNNDIMNGLYLPVINEVLALYPTCILFDVKSAINIFDESQASMIKNPANTVVGNNDGVHLTGTEANTINNGRLICATAMIPLCVGKTKIVIIGDSNMAQGGATSVPIYLSLALNS